MKPLLLAFLLLSFHADSQIILKGYKCCGKDNDYGLDVTFCNEYNSIHYHYYGRQMPEAIGWDDSKPHTKAEEAALPQKELRYLLHEVFGDTKYTKTKEGLYTSNFPKARKNCGFIIFLPEVMGSIEVYSKYNDKHFADISKYLLGRIRKNPKLEGNMELQNEKGDNCSMR